MRRAVWDTVGCSKVDHTGEHPGEPVGQGHMTQKFLVQMKHKLISTLTPPLPTHLEWAESQVSALYQDI